MHFYIGPTDAGKGATGKFHDAIPEEMSNSSKARNHFSEIGVRNRLRRITRKLFPPPPLLPPPSPPCGRRSLSLLLRNRFLPSPEEHSKEGGREEPSAALLLRPLDSPQLRSAVNQPFHRPAHTSQKSRR